MKPFKIDVAQATLDSIRARVKAYEWHEMPRGEGLEGTWAYGATLDFMRGLCAYWVDGYDWRNAEATKPQPKQTKNVVRVHPHHRQASASGEARRRREGCVHCRRAVPARLWLVGKAQAADRAAHPRAAVRQADDRCREVAELYRARRRLG